MVVGSLLTLPLDEVARRLESLRQGLVRADVEGLHSDAVRRDTGALLKSHAYVAIAASLEYYVKSLLDAVLDEIAVASVALSKLRPSLFSMLCAREFSSIASASSHRSWEQRVGVLERMQSSEIFTGNGYLLPLDGKTLRANHFGLIWRTFGFPGNYLPHPKGLYVGILEDLADGRNKVAHGEVDPIRFGRNKVVADILKILDRIENIANHLALAAETYLYEKVYMR